MQTRRLTRRELSRYNGKNGVPAYIACEGLVYDVTGSFLWPEGEHQAFHAAGADLTASLHEAPHGAGVLAHLSIVGTLEAD
jgi:predicted heme/steroid binding protein